MINKKEKLTLVFLFLTGLLLLSLEAFGNIKLPQGNDISGELESVGTMLKTADTIIFGYIRVFMAGIFIMATAFYIKGFKLQLAGLCFVACLVLVFAPQLVNNITNQVNGNTTIFNK